MKRPPNSPTPPVDVDPLRAIASPPPLFSRSEVAAVLQAEYGLRGSLSSLVSERDQNFRLTADDSSQYVVKIANAAEDAVITDFQVQALLYLERADCAVTVPRVQPTHAGDIITSIANSDTKHVLRVISYVPGKPLAEVPLDRTLAHRLGITLAVLATALSEFRHPGESPALLWDMQRAVELRPLLVHIADSDLRTVVSGCLDDFEHRALPQLTTLRHQVVHNDFNPGNVLLDNGRQGLASVIDFGDMLYAPLIVDVAIAASYMRRFDSDPTQHVMSFLAGYHGHTSLMPAELDLFYDLIRMRLATTITLLSWRLAARDESDPYRQQALDGEGDSHRFLIGLDEMPRDQFRSLIDEACRR